MEFGQQVLVRIEGSSQLEALLDATLFSFYMLRPSSSILTSCNLQAK